MADFLRSMAAASARRAKQARSREPLPALRRRARETPAPGRLVRHSSGFDLIAEIKLRAPSSGRLLDSRVRTPGDVGSRAAGYAAAGAAAVSVLTEPTAFGGDLGHLAAASRTASVPTMRKDFLVDPYQILEARAAGAGGVLLILRMLDDPLVTEMLDAAAEAGLFVLLEAFDAEDLARAAQVAGRRTEAAESSPVLIGVNSRDLVTLSADRGRLLRLLPWSPPGIARVAESGIGPPEGVAELAAAGYDFALVGGALMRAADPPAMVRAMLAQGRSARTAPREAE